MTDRIDELERWDRIRANTEWLLAHQGIPYTSASRMIGLSEPYLQQFIRGYIHKLPAAAMDKLLEVLGVPPMTLLRDPEDVPWPLTKQELRLAVSRLEALRHRKGMTRGDFGRWLGYQSKTGWQNVAKGHRRLSKASWIRIGAKTGIPLASLIRRERRC